MKNVAVIGAGAAGLMAAYAAAKGGAKVTVFEKNEKAGKKIYITGKGRCNVTNACESKDFFNNIVSNPKFMYKSFNAFSNRDLMAFIEKNGTKLKVERGNRVFPVSNHASDITKALLSSLDRANINFKFNNTVSRILINKSLDEKSIKGLICDEGEISFDSVILAAGGAAYPGAGGTKLGYKLASDLGHNITEIRPSLVPIKLKEEYIKEIQGVSLRNVTLTVRKGEKQIFKNFGELLFTHFGLSGPLVLTASALVGNIIITGGCKAYIDFKPAIPDKELDERLIKIIEDNPKKQYKSFYGGLLPKSFQELFVRISKIEPQKRLSDLKKEERKVIFKLLREFPLEIEGLCGFNEAIITKGGVDIREVNPKTMESKIIKELFICGEILDVDALTGGFNLQIAFSTGYVAGVSSGG